MPAAAKSPAKVSDYRQQGRRGVSADVDESRQRGRSNGIDQRIKLCTGCGTTGPFYGFPIHPHLEKLDPLGVFNHALAGIDFDDRGGGDDFGQPARSECLATATLLLGYHQHLCHKVSSFQ
jgi:hypothetical protein